MPDTPSNVPLAQSTSIVVPCFNARATVGEAVETCLAQGVSGERLIVVDDGSTDGSAAAAERYGPKITLLRRTKGGASAARNAGLERVATPYVLFLDADDLYEGPIVDGLQRAAESVRADIAFGTTTNVWPDAGRERAVRHPPDTRDANAFLVAWLDGKTVQTNSHLWRADFLRQIGGWNEDMKILEEIEVVARGILNGARLAASLEGTSLYRHQNQPGRAGQKSSAPVVRSAVEGFSRLEPLTLGRPSAVRRALGKRLYIQARTAHRLGHAALGRKALARARALGFRGHAGTRGHRLLAALVGLEQKEALVRTLGDRKRVPPTRETGPERA